MVWWVTILRFSPFSGEYAEQQDEEIESLEYIYEEGQFKGNLFLPSISSSLTIPLSSFQ